ncbi:MAG: hypothetical protein AAFN70_08985, partial [Planctomycetota bacterium]
QVTRPLSRSSNDASPSAAPRRMFAATVGGDTRGLTIHRDADDRIVITIPPSQERRVLRFVRSFRTDGRIALRETARNVVDPMDLTLGGPVRWPQIQTTTGRTGESVNGYALDTIRVPFENPWNAWLRTSALDFFDNGRCVVTTHGGDVYLVDGLDGTLESVRWKRFAAGLFEPFGVRVQKNTIYVTCRDGLKRLHDYDQNDECDYVEAFWNDDDVSSMFHAYNFDLQTDSAGNFYFAKAGQYTRHHRPGTIMRIPPEGGRADVVAWGLRTPNGMGKLADDRFTVSDNQGPWMPAGKISLIKKDRFYGNMPINDEQEEWLSQRHGGQRPETFEQPLIWTPQELDNSCGGQTWVSDERFGPLANRLMHSSFGKGWLYYMDLQEIGDQTQAAMISLPHQWDAGVMRLRVNPADGQLYGTGLSGWQGPDGGSDGCLQRLRYTGAPAKLVDQVRVEADGLKLRFTFDINPDSVRNPDAWNAEMWNYLWSRRYGSDQFKVTDPETTGHDEVAVKSVQIIDSKTVRLVMPNLQPCHQLHLKMDFLDNDGNPFIEEVYATIHNLPTAARTDSESRSE